MNLIDLLLNIDENLVALIRQYGVLTHLILFGVIFCETGLVIMPFLPGDSLLFAAGLFATPQRQGLSLPILLALLPVASILGDTVNFHLGKLLGHRLFRENNRFFKPHYLEKTRAFYEKHGAKTIILGRFVPIVRTVSPFVAGMDAMPFRTYLRYCVIGSLAWVFICVMAGFLLGNVPWVSQHFEHVVLGIIILSLLAIVKEVVKDRRESRAHVAAHPTTD